mgnify:CR=1 FL=1
MKKNKTLRVATSLMLVASTAAVAAAPVQTNAATKKPVLKSKFTDVKKGDYFHDAVVTLTNEQVLNGYGDQTFRPNVPTTRGHIAIVLTRVLNLQATQYVNIQDMPTTHDTYEYAAAAIIHGLMETDQYNNFNPKSELSRYEYAEILTRAYNLQPTYKKTHKFKNVPEQYKVAVQTVFDHGLMRGVSTTDFGGYQNITRGQMAVTLINARALSEKEPTFTGKKTTQVLSYNSTTKKIKTADGEFKIRENLQPLFTVSNKSILQNAVITANFAGNEIISIQDIELVNPSLMYANESFAQLKPNLMASRHAFEDTLSSSTTTPNNAVASNMDRVLDLGGLSIPGKIILKRERTTIRNGSAGQIIVTDDADRSLTLSNVEVKDLVVEDSYYRDFLLTLTNTLPTQLVIDRDDVHLKSNQRVPQVFLTDNAYSIELQAPIGVLHLMKDGYASLYGQISIDRLLVPEEAYVYVGSAGYIKEAEILDRGGELSFTSNVRFGTVTVPPQGRYEDYINYYGDMKQVIAKVKVPGSDNNLFHDVIQLPSKEEIQRQELFDKLVDKFEATANRNQLTIISRLNSFSTSMRDYPVRLSFTLTSGLSHLPNNTVIPTTISFKGRTTKHNFTVANLRAGVLTTNLQNELLTLKDLSPNSDNRLNVEFDTPFPMTVRGNLVINGYTKGTSEVLLNSQYIDDVQTLIYSVTATESSNSVKVEKRYGTIADKFDQINEEMRLQLTQLRKPVADSKIIPFTITYTFDGKEQKKEISDVTLAQLKSGLSLYSLLGVNEKKLLINNGNKSEVWDIKFNDTLDADFKVFTSIQGIDVKSTSFKVNHESSTIKAVKDLETSVDKGTVKLVKTYNAIDSSLENKAQDVKMTLTSVTTPSANATRVPFIIKYKLADGQEQTKEIKSLKVEDLKKGVSLYSLLAMSEQKVTADLGSKVETFEINFKEMFNGSLRFDAIVDSKVEKINTAKVNSQVAATPSIAKLELSKLNRGLKIEKTYGAIQSIANGRKHDLKLKVVSSTQPTTDMSNVEFKIKYRYDNDTVIEQTFSDKSLKELKAGVSVYSLLGLPLPKIEDANSEKIETIEVEFLTEFVGKVEVAAEVETEQPVKKVLDASYTGVAVENLAFNNIDKGFKVEQMFGTPISTKFYNEKTDVIVKFQTTMPDSLSVPFKIEYEGLEAPTSKTVAELKKGVSLYTLLDVTGPTLNSSLDGKIENFTITFDGNVIGKFNVQSMAGEGNQAKVVAETGFKDVYVADTASKAFTVTKDGLQLIFKRKFEDFKNEIVGSPIDVKLRATNIMKLTEDDTVNVAIKRNNETEKIVKNVKVSELKAGKSLYSLIGIAQPKIEAKNKNAEETWTVRFLEVIDGTFSLDAYQGGKLINSSLAENFSISEQTLYSIEEFTTKFEDYQLKIATTYSAASTDQTIKEYPVDVLLKAAESLENESDQRVVQLNIKQGSTVYPGPYRVSVKDLKEGIKLSKIIGQQSLGKIGSHANKTDQWVITINDQEKGAFNAQLDTFLLVNGKTIGEAKNVPFENKASTINKYVEYFDITATEANSQFTTKLKFKNQSSISTTFGYLPVDAKLTITAGVLQNDKYAVTITANPQFSKEVEVSRSALMQGVKLSDLTGLSAAKLADHSETADWTFEVKAIGEKQEGTVSAKIDLLIGEYKVRSAQLKDFAINKTKSTNDK